MDASATNPNSKTSAERSSPPLPVADNLPLSRPVFYFGLLLVVASLVLGTATYLILTGETNFVPTERLVNGLLGANVVLVLLLVAAIAWQIIAVARARAKGSAGARLHVRLVAMFSLVAVLPAVLVAIFATVTLDRGLDAWFSARTQAIIDNAQNVAESYLREHAQVIRGDVLAMSTDLNRAITVYRTNPQDFFQILTQQAQIRALSAAYVIRDDGQVGAQAISSREIQYTPPPEEAIQQAKAGQVVIFEPGGDYMVRALVELENFDRGLLYVYRRVDEVVINHLRATRERRAEYDALAVSRSGVQATFAFLYIGMALIFLLAAIWFGLWVANRLVSPIGRLINAARQVSHGDLSVKVDVSQREGDIASLARTFNEMTGDLKRQRTELVAANDTLDERRRFMEAVLSGVSAGVVGLDREGRVEVFNRSALELLDLPESELLGSPLAETVPEFASLLQTAKARPGRPVDEQLSLIIGGSERTVHARVTNEPGQGDDATSSGHVVTFDDITELQTAQRSSAWADIARRIAHEIKNPLTPIQLSAERLKRKYGKHIETDREVFEQCTETIIRQVGDIGRMVDEFSSFARMPKASFEAGDLKQVVRDAVILQKMSLQNVAFDVQVPDNPVEFAFDRRLITQALTNLIKNASEAIEAVEGKDGLRGRIAVRLARPSADRVTVEVIDNGCGLPTKDRNRLTEPYMTTREKGTGLGLAIVRRIAEEHGGTIALEDAPAVAEGGHGALVRLEFPIRDAVAEKASPGAAAKTDASRGEENSSKEEAEKVDDPEPHLTSVTESN